MIRATFLEGKIISNTKEAFALWQKSMFGERKREFIEYSSFEALFLIDENKMSLEKNKKSVTKSELLRRIKKSDKRFNIKYAVFQNLRKKGYIVKTALKFGTDFRVYKKGQHPEKSHAYWLLHAIKENESVNWYDFAAKNRIAVTTNKKLLLGIVDEDSGIVYYEISWLKP